jgi:hypothetical protein
LSFLFHSLLMLFKMTKVGATCDPKNQRSQASSCSTTSSSTARATSRTSRSVLDDKVYDHVLRLLGFDSLMYPDHPVIEALQHGCYTDFTSVFSLRRADVESLTYLDMSVQPPVRKLLPRADQTRLLVPQGYRNYFETRNKRPIDPTDWICTTVDVVDAYMMSSDFMYFNNSIMTSPIKKTTVTLPYLSESKPTVNDMTISNQCDHLNRLNGSNTASVLPSIIKPVDSNHMHDYKRLHNRAPTDVATYSNDLDNGMPLLVSDTVSTPQQPCQHNPTGPPDIKTDRSDNVIACLHSELGCALTHPQNNVYSDVLLFNKTPIGSLESDSDMCGLSHINYCDPDFKKHPPVPEIIGTIADPFVTPTSVH